MSKPGRDWHLSVTDEAHTANIAPVGQHSAEDFTVKADDTTESDVLTPRGNE